MKQDYKHYK